VTINPAAQWIAKVTDAFPRTIPGEIDLLLRRGPVYEMA
jgi:hypothetical protein